jgi:hypothetical protein
MKWAQLSKFVTTWAAAHGLPMDMSGRAFVLVDFASEEDCGFFYPGRDLLSQRAFTMALAKLARKRHARTENVTITPDHYRTWLAAGQAGDSPENRERFIESRYRVLPGQAA